MVNKKQGIAAIVVIVVIALVAFLAFGGSVFAPKADNNTITAAVTKDCAGTPWFVGQEKGFFDQYNIDFKDAGEIPWKNQPAALASGQINVYDNHPNAIINLIKSGAKVKAVAVTGSEPTDGGNKEEWDHMHYLVKEDGPIQSIDDIKAYKEKGQKPKVAVGSTGICADLEFSAWLRKNDLTKDDVEYVILPDPQQQQALEQGQIDVAVLHPPFYNKAETDGGVNILATSYDSLGDAGGLSLLVFTEDYIEKYPGTVRDFTNAYKDGQRWANANRDEAGEITARNIGLPYTSNVHWYSESGAINDKVKGYLQEWIDAMVADGYLEEGEFTPEDIYTEEFSDTWKPNLPDN